MARHEPPWVFLVDGHALIYRAFFALISRPLTTSRGQNTSAAWGVANFLLRTHEKYAPEYLAWVLDAGDSFRRTTYPEYKSTREKLDTELQQDFELALEQVTELLSAFRVPIITYDSYEADDVIATIAGRESERGNQVVIVSGDKDFYQLIGPRIALLNPGRGGQAGVEEHWVDERNANERLGVPPAQVVDYLALVGDTSDNVPGVRGIGEKTAIQLLQQFGGLDAILANAESVSNKRAREALLAEQDRARLSRDLVTLRANVPVAFDLASSAMKEPDWPALLRALARLEFHSLVSKIQTQFSAELETASATTPMPELNQNAAPIVAPVIVDSTDRLASLVEQLRQAPIVAMQVEATSDEPHDARLVGIALASGTATTWYLPFDHQARDGELAAPAAISNLPSLSDPACAPLVSWLTDPGAAKAGHNIKFAWQVLRGAGVELAGVRYDSMLASFVLDPGRRSHSIETLSLDHFGRPMHRYEEVAARDKSKTPFAEVPVAEAAIYAATDASTVLALHEYFEPRLRDTELTPLLEDVEVPLIAVLCDMEWTGIAIDRSVFDQLSRELTSDLLRLEADISRAAGGSLNLNSPRQLASVLFEKLGLPVLKRTKTGPSTDADVLEQLAEMGHELPRFLLEFRELQKLRSTYVDVLPTRVNPVTGRIHTRFNQTGAATGRLSSSDPNLQNIPIRTPRGEAIRRGFVPGPGCRFIIADYSQIELRLMAHLSGDPAFVQAFRSGGDIHRQTAAIIFGIPVEQVTAEMRARAKTINFATIYGQGPVALSRQLGISMDEAKSFIAQYFERFSGVRAYLDRQVQLARKQGFVETLFKRRRYIPEIKDKNFNTRSFGERLAQNSPLQGSAADLIKIAMARIHRAMRERGLDGKLLLQVHDELVLEAPIDQANAVAALVCEHMEGAASLDVPLAVGVGIGDNWLDAKH